MNPWGFKNSHQSSSFHQQIINIDWPNFAQKPHFWQQQFKFKMGVINTGQQLLIM
jgi:hypothetical protein